MGWVTRRNWFLQVYPGWAGYPDGFLQVYPGWAGHPDRFLQVNGGISSIPSQNAKIPICLEYENTLFFMWELKLGCPRGVFCPSPSPPNTYSYV